MEKFNKIYGDNHKLVLKYVINKIKDVVVSEEITNDIFMKVYNNLDNYDSEKSSMKTWIINITSNTVIDYYRKKKLETISINKDIDNGEGKSTSFVNKLVDKTQTPFEALHSKERMMRIDDKIFELGKKDFEIAYFFFKEELNYQEIADVLVIPLGTVKARISRVKKKLQLKLETV